MCLQGATDLGDASCCAEGIDNLESFDVRPVQVSSMSEAEAEVAGVGQGRMVLTKHMLIVQPHFNPPLRGNNLLLDKCSQCLVLLQYIYIHVQQHAVVEGILRAYH